MGMIFQLYNYRDAIIDIASMISIVKFNGSVYIYIHILVKHINDTS